MWSMDALTKLLGGRSVLGTTLRSGDDLVELVRGGSRTHRLKR
jgi:hypothetical protein